MHEYPRSPSSFRSLPGTGTEHRANPSYRFRDPEFSPIAPSSPPSPQAGSELKTIHRRHNLWDFT
jgi:hypothetical protein